MPEYDGLELPDEIVTIANILEHKRRLKDLGMFISYESIMKYFYPLEYTSIVEKHKEQAEKKRYIMPIDFKAALENAHNKSFNNGNETIQNGANGWKVYKEFYLLVLIGDKVNLTKLISNNPNLFGTKDISEVLLTSRVQNHLGHNALQWMTAYTEYNPLIKRVIDHLAEKDLSALEAYYQQGVDFRLLFSLNEHSTENLLVRAVEQKNLKALQFFLDHKSDFGITDATLINAFVRAVELNDPEAYLNNNNIIDALLKVVGDGIDKRATYYPNENALLAAIRKKNFNIVNLLIENDANVNQPWDDVDSKPINTAARNGQHRVVKLLLKHGAFINNRNKNVKVSCVPLVEALSGATKNMMADYKDTISLLLHAGADTSAIPLSDPSINVEIKRDFKNKKKKLDEIAQGAGKEIFDREKPIVERSILLFKWYIKQSPLKHNFHYKAVARKIVEALEGLPKETLLTQKMLNDIIQNAFKEANKSSQSWWRTPLDYAKINQEGHFKAIENLISDAIEIAIVADNAQVLKISNN